MKTDSNKIKEFVSRWTGKGYEKGQSQIFWIELLTEVLGIDTPSNIISFEDQVKLDHTSFIDAYIPKTHVMIEQKSISKDLRAPIKQSDGTLLNPFQQAKRYASELPYSMRPRWIVTCNFKSFLIYDMEQPQGEPFEILLENLEKEAHMLTFIVEEKDANLKHEMEISIQAGEIVGRLYDAFLAQYGNDTTEEDLHSLNVLCVRLVFCFYAEDAGIFEKDQFSNYLQTFNPENMRMAIKDLFQVLDTPTASRDRFLEPKLKAFPYVNGSLFKMQPHESIPPITPDTANLLIHHAAQDFDWSGISPTIFGAVFESTLNPETRRSGGMHYTSIENIHKVIDPLFMDDLQNEFEELNQQPAGKVKTQQLENFQDKLASLKFLDPACGSGNFLTESYMSLRRLENKVIRQLTGGQMMMGFDEVNPIKIHIQQFYGIEINDFAVTVAKTALWIAEAQMMDETEKIIRFDNDYLPLKAYDNIVEGNALRIDWADVVNPKELNYIIGNPPFVGARLMSVSQKKDMLDLFGKKWKNIGNLDYVSAWYKKAANLMQGTNIRAALVSTNSICQGEQVANLWKPLMEDSGVQIDFAYRTFRWDSESSQKAHVHCIIVGFSTAQNKKNKIIFDGEIRKQVVNINGYLIEGQNVFIDNRSKTLCNIPEIKYGSFALDDSNYTIKQDEYDYLISKDPTIVQFLKPFIGAYEMLHSVPRFCVWLKGVSPTLMNSNSVIKEKVARVKLWRSQSDRRSTKLLADTPTLFAEIRQPDTNYLAIPTMCSGNRKYIPIMYLTPDIIASNQIYVVPDATLFHFGVLISNIHMAWMRAVCGRLKSDYRYSSKIVYNNFPWPTPTEEQKHKIEHTAQAILDARALYPDSSLADLYDEVIMPPELRKAHQDNDRAVMAAYGFPVKNFTESDCVAELFKLYQKLTRNK